MLGEVVIMNALSHCLQSAKDCHENTNSSLIASLINFGIRNGVASSGSCLCKDWICLFLCQTVVILYLIRACLHVGGGRQVGEVTCGGLPHLTCKQDHIKMRDYMDRRVAPPKRFTSPIWGTPPPCKQSLNLFTVMTQTSHLAWQRISNLGEIFPELDESVELKSHHQYFVWNVYRTYLRSFNLQSKVKLSSLHSKVRRFVSTLNWTIITALIAQFFSADNTTSSPGPWGRGCW